MDGNGFYTPLPFKHIQHIQNTFSTLVQLKVFRMRAEFGVRFWTMQLMACDGTNNFFDAPHRGMGLGW